MFPENQKKTQELGFGTGFSTMLSHLMWEIPRGLIETQLALKACFCERDSIDELMGFLTLLQCEQRFDYTPVHTGFRACARRASDLLSGIRVKRTAVVWKEGELN